VNLSQTYINSTSTEIKVEDCDFRMSMKKITVNCKNCSAAEKSTIDSSLLKTIHDSNDMGCSLINKAIDKISKSKFPISNNKPCTSQNGKSKTNVDCICDISDNI